MNISSIYLHVPFCRHLCNYCDFFKYRENSVNAPSWEEFESKLLKSFEELVNLNQAKGFKLSTEMKTVYLGGGTPSLWGERGIEFLNDFFEKNKISVDQAQFTLEVDPGTCTPSELQRWKALGVNRFSVGLQTLNKDYLAIADRKHTYDDAIDMLKLLQGNDADFSADFLLGLPKISTVDRNIEDELEQILSYGPKHLSLYILTVPKSYPHYDKLPDEDEIANEYLKVSEILTAKGFDHYEVSNFAKPQFESLHNFIYWNGESYFGIGPSSTGQWRYGAEKLERYKWSPSYKMINEVLGDEEIEMENLYLNLRTNRGFSANDYPTELIQRWLKDQLIEKYEANYRCTAYGYLVVDSMIEQVFSHITT